jgi:hypothetical protein
MSEAFAAFVLSGRAIDLVLAVILLEAVALIAWRGRAKALGVVVALLPGVFLLLALREALGERNPWLVALWLALSFPPHLLDLWRRKP